MEKITIEIKKHWLIVLLVGAAAFLGFMLFYGFHSFSRQTHPKMGPVTEAVYGIGTVTARHTYQLKLGVMDTLKKLYIDEGASVKKDDPLVYLVDGHVIRAPFPGVVSSLPFKEGETLFPQIPVLTLTDPKNAYVVVSLEQSGAIPVRTGQKTVLSFESLRGQKFDGTVSAIYPKDGNFYVNIEAPGLPSGVLVGMTCDVAIQVAVKDNVLQIPSVAVDKGVVTVLRGGIPKKVPVKLGATDGTWTEVVDNSVQVGDTLILPGK